MNPTATIRVPVETRDRLAAIAQNRGQSISGYLSALSKQEFDAAIVNAERQATEQDAANPAARAEYDLWEGTLDDGLG